MRAWGLGLVAAAAVAAPVVAQAPTEPTPDPPAAVEQVRLAGEVAGRDQTAPLFLCRSDPNTVIQAMIKDGGGDWLEPTQVFDNLYYVGTRFVGVWALRTSEGLILFDAGTSIDDVKNETIPRLRKLGLDPADIRYAIVTHGHWDHYGGAPHLQEVYGTRIVLSAPDWLILEKAPSDGMEKEGLPPPRRDMVATDGQKLTLGDTTVTLFVTPGHTPGTLAALVPVKDGGETHVLSLMGGTAFPPIRGSNNRTGGLVKFSQSVQRLRDLSLAAGAEGLLNTHAFADGNLDRMAALRTRAAGAPHPFLIGTEAVGRYYQVVDHCLKAAIARPEGDSAWAHAFDEHAPPGN